MKLKNNLTGDILEVPPPDSLGSSVVKFNGRIVEQCLYSDANGGTITTGEGKVFASHEDWTEYLIDRLSDGWK